MVINNNKILYLLCQLIRPLIYIVCNTTYKLYINSGDVMLILGGENLFTKPSYFYHNTNGHGRVVGGGVIKIYVIQQD